VVLIIGAADYTVTLGGFAMNGITLGTLSAIVRYQVFRGAGPGRFRDHRR
jgi:hypothetical protein